MDGGDVTGVARCRIDITLRHRHTPTPSSSTATNALLINESPSTASGPSTAPTPKAHAGVPSAKLVLSRHGATNPATLTLIRGPLGPANSNVNVTVAEKRLHDMTGSVVLRGGAVDGVCDGAWEEGDVRR